MRRARNIGSKATHIGTKRTDESEIETAMAGQAIFAATALKNSNWAGPAQMKIVEPTATSSEKPASRAMPPTPTRLAATISMGPPNACRAPSRYHAPTLRPPRSSDSSLVEIVGALVMPAR